MTDTTELTVLKMLAAQRRVQWVATATALYPKDVLAIADKHGALSDGEVDVVAAGHAAAELSRRTGQPIPERAPAPPAPPAPPARRRPPAAGPGLDQVLADVPIADLHPDPDNPRADVGDVTELAASMSSVGLLQPVVARRAPGGRLVLVAGHRRLAAAELLLWGRVPTLIRRDMRPDAVLAAMLVENSHRKDLDPIEEARALRRLQVEAGGCSHSVLAARIGRTQAHVSARLALLALPAEDQEALRAKQMSLGEAVHKARVSSGRVKPKGQDKGWHLGPSHQLGARAKARCQRLGHSRGRGVGGMACGACWESVIRADERDHLNTVTAKRGTCALCDTPIGPAETTPITLREATA